MWAYHSTNDTANEKHSLSGHQEIDFFKQAREEPVVNFYGSDSPTTGASAIAASIIGNFLLFVIAVIFFY